MATAKIRLESSNLEKFKTSCEYADVRIEKEKIFGGKAQVEVVFKTGEQLYIVGKIEDSIIPVKKPLLNEDSIFPIKTETKTDKK